MTPTRAATPATGAPAATWCFGNGARHPRRRAMYGGKAGDQPVHTGAVTVCADGAISQRWGAHKQLERLMAVGAAILINRHGFQYSYCLKLNSDEKTCYSDATSQEPGHRPRIRTYDADSSSYGTVAHRCGQS